MGRISNTSLPAVGYEQVRVLRQKCLAEHKVGILKGLLHVNRSIGTPSNVVTWGNLSTEHVTPSAICGRGETTAKANQVRKGAWMTCFEKLWFLADCHTFLHWINTANIFGCKIPSCGKLLALLAIGL